MNLREDWGDANPKAVGKISRKNLGWIPMPLGRKPTRDDSVIDPDRFLREAVERFRLVEAQDTKVETLYVFDMDDTLLHHPSQKGGMAQWKRFTGKDWPHGHRWWSISATLKPPFKFARVTATKAAFKKAKADPKGKVVVMTGRLATKGFKETIPELLRQLGLGTFKFGETLFLKRTNERSTLAWKKKMISGFLRRYPNLKALHMWDDRGDHVTEFSKHIKKLGVKGKVTHVQEPTPSGIDENFPNRPALRPTMFAPETWQISPTKTPKDPSKLSVGTADDVPKPMKNKGPGNMNQRTKGRAAGRDRHKHKSGPSLLGRVTSYTGGRGDEFQPGVA
jgi:hypothetical protein